MVDHWTRAHSIGILGLTVAIVVLGLVVPGGAHLLGWLGTLVLMLAFTVVAGHGITGLWRGAFIDERNKLSLSRFQLVLWTTLVLSAFLTAALGNVAGGYADPLAIRLPQELWLLMGISTTSLVASPLLSSTKRTRAPSDVQMNRTFDLLSKQGIDKSKVTAEGLLVVNASPAQAQWSDLFKGDETGNAAQLDVGKVQMFYFTVVIAVAYGVALAASLEQTVFPFTAFPALSPSILALLGISHAGYLVNKAVPHSATT